MLLTLQNRGKWNKQQRNCKVGDVVLLKEDAEHNQWPMAKIVAVNSDAKGDVHSIKILVGAANKSDNSIRYLERPVNKLVVLVENEDDDELVQLDGSISLPEAFPLCIKVLLQLLEGSHLLRIMEAWT